MSLPQLLAADQIAALATAFAVRLDAGRALPFPLTAKLVENAVEGARKAPGGVWLFVKRLAQRCACRRDLLVIACIYEHVHCERYKLP